MKEINFTPKLTGLFGHPVSENPTVLMIESAFRSLKLDNWRYITLDVPADNLEQAIDSIRLFKMRGVHLTIPHKVEAIKHVDVITKEAKMIGAINTIVNDNGKLTGYNTDGKGFMTSLQKDAKIVELKSKKAMILGSGGAARAIAVELAIEGINSLTIVNRTEKRGLDLINDLQRFDDLNLNFRLWDHEIDINDIDILIQATSIGLYPNKDLPKIKYDQLTQNMLTCDLIPNPAITPFLKKCESNNARLLDGLGMLVYQGAIAFELWTKRSPSTDIMKRSLETFFKNN